MTTDAATADPLSSEDIAAVRRQMLSFALLQLRDEPLAEDAVQEALAGALRNAASFAGRAALRTWMFGILRHKITDILRQRLRDPLHARGYRADADDEEDLDELFDGQGMWQVEERPASWGDPDASLQSKQFWRVFEACLERVPAQQGRVFMMREYLGLETGEICAELNLSTSNLNVMLHRARLRLRHCLQDRWFSDRKD